MFWKVHLDDAQTQISSAGSAAIVENPFLAIGSAFHRRSVPPCPDYLGWGRSTESIEKMFILVIATFVTGWIGKLEKNKSSCNWRRYSSSLSLSSKNWICLGRRHWVKEIMVALINDQHSCGLGTFYQVAQTLWIIFFVISIYSLNFGIQHRIYTPVALISSQQWHSTKCW